ncbi:MAG: AI-2E family transporter [Gemmatimonadota bacterium]
MPPDDTEDTGRSRRTSPPLDMVGLLQASAVLLVLAFFLWSLRATLSPFLLFWVLLGALLPFRGTIPFRVLGGVASVLTLIWLLAEAGSVLAPFVLGMILAYILNPLVVRVGALGLSRTWAIVALLVPALGGLTLALVWGLPALGAQFSDLIERLPTMISRADGWTASFRDWVASLAIPGMERLASFESADMLTFLNDRKAVVGEWLLGGALGVGRGVGFVLSILGFVLLTPVITFYLLRDWEVLQARLEGLLPRRSREEVMTFAREYDEGVGAYLQGQLLVSLTVGALTAMGLWLAQFPYALLLGLVVAIFSVVPYLGLVLSLIPALLIAVVSPPVGLSLLKVAVVYGVAQGLESSVISPRIVGDSTGLNPVWVVFALALGGLFFGFVGLLLAVPAAVGVKLLVVRALDRYRRSSLYGADGEADPLA